MREAGHTFLARMGKTVLRPGGKEATSWLLKKAQITPDAKVLEVACNMGTTLIQVVKTYGCSAVGLDLDEKALAHARENVSKAGLAEKITLVQGSAFALPFPDSSFDVIINEAMLTMLTGSHKEQALAEYARVLKPGGILLTHDVFLRTEDPAVQKEIRAGLSRAINVAVEPLTLESWKNVIEQNGFATEQKSGPMSLLEQAGMLRDEGVEGTLKILFNAAQTANHAMFAGMYNFFHDHQKELGYVANYSVKQ